MRKMVWKQEWGNKVKVTHDDGREEVMTLRQYDAGMASGALTSPAVVRGMEDFVRHVAR